MKKIILGLFLLAVITAGYFIYARWQKVEASNSLVTAKIVDAENKLKNIKPPPPPPPPLMTQPKEGVVIQSKPITIPDVNTQFKAEQQVYIELIGVLKLQLNPHNSWETIAQMLVLLLFSYGGIKYINKRFA